MRRLCWLLLFTISLACSSERSRESRAVSTEDIVVPEYTLQVDFGVSDSLEAFWLDWTEQSSVLNSQRTVEPAFGQQSLQVELDSCGTSSFISKDCSGSLSFISRQPYKAGDLALVLADGMQVSKGVQMSFRDLPVGKYELEVFFHDSSSEFQTEIANTIDFGLGAIDLPSVSSSIGADQPAVARLLYPFNITSAKSIRVEMMAEADFLVNGFRLSKFFGEPDGKEPTPVDPIEPVDPVEPNPLPPTPPPKGK